MPSESVVNETVSVCGSSAGSFMVPLPAVDSRRRSSRSTFDQLRSAFHAPVFVELELGVQADGIDLGVAVVVVVLDDHERHVGKHARLHAVVFDRARIGQRRAGPDRAVLHALDGLQLRWKSEW